MHGISPGLQRHAHKFTTGSANRRLVGLEFLELAFAVLHGISSPHFSVDCVHIQLGKFPDERVEAHKAH